MGTLKESKSTDFQAMLPLRKFTDIFENCIAFGIDRIVATVLADSRNSGNEEEVLAESPSYGIGWFNTSGSQLLI